MKCARIRKQDMELVILDPNFKSTDNCIRIVASLTSSWEAERLSDSERKL